MRTELPNKWGIKITSENETILKKYWKSIPNLDHHYSFNGWLLSDSGWDKSGLFYGDLLSLGSYLEISFEEFKFFILNDSLSQPQFNYYEIY